MTLIRIARTTPAIDGDDWTHVAAGEALPDAPAILPLARWLAQREALMGRNAPLGVRLRSDERIDAILGDLPRLALVALDFPNMADGRHFTTARLLRERHGFTGEIRATGRVLRDQLHFMARCGFDSFELAPGKDADEALAAFGEIRVAYQPAADSHLPASANRAWTTPGSAAA